MIMNLLNNLQESFIVWLMVEYKMSVEYKFDYRVQLYFFYFSKGNTKVVIKSCIYDGTMPVFILCMKESLCCCLICYRVVHPHSLYRFSNDIDIVNPVTSRAASFWIFCSVTRS